MRGFAIPVMACIALLATPAAAQTAFFSTLNDVPLPPGFSERAEGAVFDAGRGRLILGFAIGPNEPMAVRSFYFASLPQLGWTVSERGAGMTFVRGREKLNFAMTVDADSRLRLDAVLTADRASVALE